MKVKLTFDSSVQTDDLPDQSIVVEEDDLDSAFATICDKLESINFAFSGPAVESVKILGKDGRDVTNEFNEFWEEY